MRNFAVMVVLVLVVMGVGGEVLSRQSGEVFLEKFFALRDEIDSMDYDWHGSELSPFYVYRGEDYIRGARRVDGELYERALLGRDCKTVGRLEREGFLRSHPQLRDIFEGDGVSGVNRDYILVIFYRVILLLTEFSNYMYCRHARDIDKAWAIVEREGLRLRRFDMRDPESLMPSGLKREYKDRRKASKGRWREPKEEWKAYHERCYGIGGLISLAVLRDHRRSLADLLNLMEPGQFGGAIILHEDLELYLRKRAELLGVDQKRKVYHYRRLYGSLPPDRIAEIETLAEDGEGVSLSDNKWLITYFCRQ